jgi:hypothetical protein
LHTALLVLSKFPRPMPCAARIQPAPTYLRLREHGTGDLEDVDGDDHAPMAKILERD